MSGTPGSRAAVFTQQSQGVEVRVEGAWWPGAILGWRHDDGGSCEVWVRVAVAGEDRATWSDLADLRLPEPDGTSSTAAASPVARRAATSVTSGAPAPQRHRRAADVTAELPAVGPLGLAGRHRAPVVPGRHRAVEEGADRPDAPAAGGTALLVRPEADCLTRPLRLGDRAPRPRSRPEVPRPR